jgi:hypothetical protein
VGGLAVVLIAGCTSNPSPTIAPATGMPTPSALATVPSSSPGITVACGPLAQDLCQSAVAVVEQRVAPLALAPIADVQIEPNSSFVTCQPLGASACSVTAVVTFTKPGPFAIGLVLLGNRWISSGPTRGWWGTDGGTYCAVPARYRLSGQVRGIGACVGVVLEPAEITLTVGQKLDLHMTVIPSSGRPFFPLPWSTAPRIFDQESAPDAATATYVALSPGTAVLTTVGGCPPKAGTTGSATDNVAACPMAEIRVITPQ